MHVLRIYNPIKDIQNETKCSAYLHVNKNYHITGFDDYIGNVDRFFFAEELLGGGIPLVLIVLLCLLSAPIAYEMSGSQLTIVSRINKKSFGPVLKCSYVEDTPSFGFRLWGNGGLFAVTGIFWNRKYGIFRAYVTRGKGLEIVLVETPETKVLITPEKPGEFIVYANSLNSNNGKGSC